MQLINHIHLFMSQRHFIAVRAGFAAIALFSTTGVMAQGNLLVSPKRLVFDGPRKTQELNLANTGKDTATYLISIKEIRMTEDGAFQEILVPDSGQNFASKYLRFFPRTVTLAPNEAQTVKVQLTKQSELQPGEYRSHIYFRAVPKTGALGETDDKSEDSGISVRLTPVFGITIPAIIRVGESDTRITVSDINFEMVGDTMPRIGMTLNRSGNMSAYGDVKVEYIGPDGKVKDLGMAKGVAIYTPNLRRKFKFDLPNAVDTKIGKGKLHVSYVLQPEDKSAKKDAKENVIAEATVDLP